MLGENLEAIIFHHRVGKKIPTGLMKLFFGDSFDIELD
jgi:hypothetical protein